MTESDTLVILPGRLVAFLDILLTAAQRSKLFAA